MDPDFWHQRWREGRIGFHQDRATPLLERHWQAIGVPPGARVLVPLCGKSLDMDWLAARGHEVLGVELSELAVRQFFEERGLEPETRTTGSGTHFRSGAIEIILGDAFAMDASLLAGCQAVFDRAALIALPPDLRRRYAGTVHARLPTGCRGLLVTLEYPQEEKDGPPFSVDGAEVGALFDDGWRLSLLERRDILDGQPGFVADGVTRLHTVAWGMQKLA